MQIGIVLAIPGFVGSGLDPLIGAAGDTARRRALLVLGGLGFAVSSPAGKLALAAVLGLLNSGWYAIPKARLYEALPGRSGAAVAVGGLGGLVGAAVPLVLGFVASSAGLEPTMWILVLAPLALLTASRPRRPRPFLACPRDSPCDDSSTAPAPASPTAPHG